MTSWRQTIHLLTTKLPSQWKSKTMLLAIRRPQISSGIWIQLMRTSRARSWPRIQMWTIQSETATTRSTNLAVLQRWWGRFWKQQEFSEGYCRELRGSSTKQWQRRRRVYSWGWVGCFRRQFEFCSSRWNGICAGYDANWLVIQLRRAYFLRRRRQTVIKVRDFWLASRSDLKKFHLLNLLNQPHGCFVIETTSAA